MRALYDHDGALVILKADSLWTVAENDRATRFNIGLNSLGDAYLSPMSSMGGQLVLGWGHRLLSFSGGQVADLGPGRQGRIAALQPLGVARLAVALDAGEEGISAILVYQSGGWHELLRAAHSGARFQALLLQNCPGTRPRLWFSVDGDLGYLDLPHASDAPLEDRGFAYQHEAVMVGATIDMGAPRLPKFVREISVHTRNLASGIQIDLDYQVDAEIGGARWRAAGSIYTSPLDSLPLNVGQLHAIRVRLRLLTNQATLPPVVTATLLEGFARTPLKVQWTLRVRLAELQTDRRGGLDADPDRFILWLQQAARQARKVRLRSVWQALDEKDVIVEPPTVTRQFTDAARNTWGGNVSVVLREA